MEIKIKRIDKDLPLPKYQTRGAVAIDLYSRIAAEIKSQELVLLPANVIIKIPRGYMLMVTPRSSLFKKHGLIMPISSGIIDQDYGGAQDEILLVLYNIGKKKAKIEKGERICQGIFVRIDRVEFIEVNQVNHRSRGGYGSTG